MRARLPCSEVSSHLRATVVADVCGRLEQARERCCAVWQHDSVLPVSHQGLHSAAANAVPSLVRHASRLRWGHVLPCNAADAVCLVVATSRIKVLASRALGTVPGGGNTRITGVPPRGTVLALCHVAAAHRVSILASFTKNALRFRDALDSFEELPLATVRARVRTRRRILPRTADDARGAASCALFARPAVQAVGRIGTCCSVEMSPCSTQQAHARTLSRLIAAGRTRKAIVRIVTQQVLAPGREVTCWLCKHLHLFGRVVGRRVDVLEHHKPTPDTVLAQDTVEECGGDRTAPD